MLIERFDALLPLEKGFYIVHAGGAELREPVRVFRDWLLAEAEAQPEAISRGNAR
jgi:LysR family glycine cleavage system transcriptional activator